MLLNGDVKVISISARISQEKITDIKYYIKGAVYSFCNNRKDDSGSEWFAAYNLFGEDNYYWQEPIIDIYNYHKSTGKDDKSACEQAGKDVGWLLKEVLFEDNNRNYEQGEEKRRFSVNKYRWIK